MEEELLKKILRSSKRIEKKSNTILEKLEKGTSYPYGKYLMIVIGILIILKILNDYFYKIVSIFVFSEFIKNPISYGF